MKLDLSAAAQADIRAIYLHSRKEWGVTRAGRYVDRLRDGLKALARGDLPGSPADHVRPGLRRLVVGSHVIWFRAEGDRLRVIRVLHGRQDEGVLG